MDNQQIIELFQSRGLIDRALAQDILGEESFAQGLTLNDFHFLLGDG